MNEVSKRRGRPSKGAEAKRAPLNLRTSPALRVRLEAAADLSGRPLTQEVEHRLEMSFLQDELLGGVATSAFLRAVGGVLAAVELQHGQAWSDDEDCWADAERAIAEFVKLNRPLKADQKARRSTSDAISSAYRGAYAYAFQANSAGRKPVGSDPVNGGLNPIPNPLADRADRPRRGRSSNGP